VNTDYLEDIYRDVSSRLDRRKSLVIGSALIVFLVHLFVSLRYIGQLDDHSTFIVVEPIALFLQEGLIEGMSYPDFQTNSYTGNPFFFIPFILLLGFTPATVEVILAGSLAVSAMIFFLIYNELFDYRRAVLGVLILLNLDFWIAQWHATDYIYVISLAAILVFLYLKWIELGFRRGKYYLYVFSFLGGLFFYFKSTILYLLAGLGLATLYQEGTDVLKQVNIPLVLILFFLGAAPFIGYIFIGDYNPFSEILGTSNPLDGGPAEVPELFHEHKGQSFSGNLATRTLQLNTILTPETPEFIRKLHVPYEYLEGLTNFGFDEEGYVSGIHLTTILFLLALSLTFLRDGKSSFGIVFISFFLLLLIVPAGSHLRVGHLIILLPFVPIIFLRNLESSKYDKIVVLLCAILAITFGSALSGYQVQSNSDLPGWGGNAEFYSDFEELEVETDVATNSFKVNTISYFFTEIDHVFIRDGTGDIKEFSPSSGGVPSVVYNEEVSLDRFEPKEPVTLILRKEMICTPGEEFCGSDTDRIIEVFGLSRSEMEEVTLGEGRFLVRQGVKLDN